MRLIPKTQHQALFIVLAAWIGMGVAGNPYAKGVLPQNPEQSVSSWKTGHGSFSGYAYGADVTMNDSGDVILVGTVQNQNANSEIVILKYSGGGNLLWEQRITADGAAVGSAVAVDAAGNIYAGGSGGPSHRFNWIISSFSPDGTERWTTQFAGDAALHDRLFELVVDGERIFASGLVGIPGISTGNSCLVAWDLDGEQLWKKQVDTIANSASRLALNQDGGIYLLGRSRIPNTQPPYNDWAAFAVWNFRQTDGELIWEDARIFSESATARAITVDAGGNVIITGTHTYRARDEYLTMKWSGSGQRYWMRTHPGIGATSGAFAIDVDEHDNIYVAGHRNFSGGGSLLKYLPNGTLEWEKPMLTNGLVRSLQISDGRIYLGGHQHLSSSLSRFFAICYNLEGEEEWALETPVETAGRTEALAIFAPGDGTLVLTGSGVEEAGIHRVLTVRAAPVEFPSQLAAEGVGLREVLITWGDFQFPEETLIHASLAHNRINLSQGRSLAADQGAFLLSDLLENRAYRFAMALPTEVGRFISPWTEGHTFNRFQQWLVDGNLPLDTDPTNQDVDGIPLLAKFAFGIPPGVTNPERLPTIEKDHGSTLFTIFVDRPELYYYPESSVDLINWQRLHPISAWSVGPVTVSYPDGPINKRFYRIRVSQSRLH